MKKKAFIASIAIFVTTIMIVASSIFIYNRYIKHPKIICELKVPDENKYLNKDNQRLIKVDGKLYYDTGEYSTIDSRCGVMDGAISSHIDSKFIPLEDNQSNFEGDYSYQYGLYGTIDVVIDHKWITFKTLNQTIDFLDANFKIELIENNSKDIKAIEYYTNKENQKIYLVGLDEIYLIDSNNKITLKDYIEKEQLTIDQSINYITSKIEYVTSIYDGGTSIYRDGGTSSTKYNESKVSNVGFKLIRCHNMLGNNIKDDKYNRDVYIGLKDLNDEEGFRNGYCGIK